MSFNFEKAVDYRDMAAKAQAGIDWEKMVVQPKRDGCFLQIVNLGGKLNQQFLSSPGKPVESCNHLTSAILDVAPWLRGHTIDGEVWLPAAPQSEVSGAFRRKSAQPGLRLMIFDVRAFNEDTLRRPYWERNQRASESLPWDLDEEVTHAGMCPGFSEKMAWSLANTHKGRTDAAFDGCILRDPYALFVPGRSKGSVIKLKPRITKDLCVVGVNVAVGEKTGRPTVALRLRYANGTEQFCGSGLTHADQSFLASSPTAWNGRIVEVESMGLTEDGFLREPVFLRVRDDKDVADY